MSNISNMSNVRLNDAKRIGAWCFNHDAACPYKNADERTAWAEGYRAEQRRHEARVEAERKPLISFNLSNW